MSDSIREAIRQLAGTHLVDHVHMAIGQVVTSDVQACTCTVELVSSKTSDKQLTVSLMADVSDGLLMVPVDGSTVIVAWSDRHLPYIAMFSDIQDIYLDATGKITMNQGAYGGLVKVGDLITRLNAIENAFNLLNSKVNALSPTPVIPNLTLTTVMQIENPNITHG